jgi:hypothetical protein
MLVVIIPCQVSLRSVSRNFYKAGQSLHPKTFSVRPPTGGYRLFTVAIAHYGKRARCVSAHGCVLPNAALALAESSTLLGRGVLLQANHAEALAVRLAPPFHEAPDLPKNNDVSDQLEHRAPSQTLCS